MDERRGAGLTEQQRRAVACRGVSVVLSSGAGCGKTHVLTQRYLAHLRDDGAEVGQLVAITFTDRAARQMRADDLLREAQTHRRILFCRMRMDGAPPSFTAVGECTRTYSRALSSRARVAARGPGYVGVPDAEASA